MLRFPYENDYDGYNVRADESPVHGKPWAFNAGTEGAYMFDGVWRGAVDLRASFRFFELDSRTSFLIEAPSETVKDAMYLGDASLFFVLARLQHWTLRVGGGARYMIDGRTPGEGKRDYALGWNVGAGFDFFPVRPLVISGRLDGGKLYAAPVVQARLTAGAAIGRIEIFGGYDHMQIGSVPLGGPLLGVRGWF